jgi:hypothetical protein
VCVCFHDILFLGRLIARVLHFFFLVIVFFVLLKFVFRKALVDLSSCDMMNFVPDSCLHTTQEALGDCSCFKGVLYLTMQINNLGKVMKCPPGGLVKT